MQERPWVIDPEPAVDVDLQDVDVPVQELTWRSIDAQQPSVVVDDAVHEWGFEVQAGRGVDALHVAEAGDHHLLRFLDDEKALCDDY